MRTMNLSFKSGAFCVAIKLRGIAEMARKSATATNAPMVAPRIRKGKAFARK